MHRTLAIASLLLSILAAAPAAAQWQRPPERWARPVFDPALADACERAFDGDYNEQRCLQIVGRARHAPAARDAIGACERAFDGDANELACLETAIGRRRPVARLIEACERAFDGDANELSCVQRATRGFSPGVVAACERAFDGDANELACIDAAALSRYEPVSLIEWCERSASGDAAELACIQRFR